MAAVAGQLFPAILMPRDNPSTLLSGKSDFNNYLQHRYEKKSKWTGLPAGPGE
jgi:hypothetical protein